MKNLLMVIAVVVMVGAYSMAGTTNWLWASDGKQITLTKYTGPAKVVIPDTLDGLPVTGFSNVFDNKRIVSVSGGANVTGICSYAFADTPVKSVSLPAVRFVGHHAFDACSSLTNVHLPSAIILDEAAFEGCISLRSITLPAVRRFGTGVFKGCSSLQAVYYGQDELPPAKFTFDEVPFVTNYVVNATAANWKATWGGKPVVRVAQ
jgi:hypothetical protein